MEEHNKKQSHMLQIMAASCVGVFIIVLISAIILVPKAVNMMDIVSKLLL